MGNPVNHSIKLLEEGKQTPQAHNLTQDGTYKQRMSIKQQNDSYFQ